MNQPTRGVKLLVMYDISPDSGRGYYDFVLGHYIPMMQTLGLQMTEAWHTAYGDFPNRQLTFVSPSADKVWQLLENEAWELLNQQLKQFVTSFDYKVVQYRDAFQS